MTDAPPPPAPEPAEDPPAPEPPADPRVAEEPEPAPEPEPGPEPAVAPADDPDEPACPHEPELDPLSKEFFLGMVFSMCAVVLGVYLAAQAGFTESSRFALLEDYHSAGAALELVRAEFESNMDRVRDAREGLKAKRPFVPIEIETAYFEAATSKSAMDLIDPLVLHEIERLYAHPLPKAVEFASSRHRRTQQVDDYAIGIFTRFLERGDEVVLPLLDSAQQGLTAAEAELRDGP